MITYLVSVVEEVILAIFPHPNHVSSTCHMEYNNLCLGSIFTSASWGVLPSTSLNADVQSSHRFLAIQVSTSQCLLTPVFHLPQSNSTDGLLTLKSQPESMERDGGDFHTLCSLFLCATFYCFVFSHWFVRILTYSAYRTYAGLRCVWPIPSSSNIRLSSSLSTVFLSLHFVRLEISVPATFLSIVLFMWQRERKREVKTRLTKN